MLTFLTFHRSLRLLHYALLLAFMVYIILFLSIPYGYTDIPVPLRQYIYR